MKVQILGYDWTVKVLKVKEFVKRFGKITAINLLDKNEIYLRDDRLTKSNICHEVTHSVFKYSCTEELRLNNAEFEELCCDLVAYHGEAIIRITNKIFKELK